jgi:hypothetical protein
MLQVVSIVGCSSQKALQDKGTALQKSDSESPCDSAVRYFIEKYIITTESGEEKEDNKAVALTFNPRNGQLQMKLSNSDGDAGEGPLKLISCNLTAGMKSGEALYEFTDEKQRPDGTKKVSTVNIKVQASNESVLISFSSPDIPGGMKMTPTRWEVVKDSETKKTETSSRQANDGGWSIDATKQIFSRDSIVKGGYTLLFYVLSPGFDSAVKRRMTDVFFTVYPKQVAQYNPDAPKKVVFMVDPSYQGVAAALGNVVRYSPAWFAQNPEDIDVVTHEVMHVVQGYNYATVPFWVTEGIADYGRAVYGVNNEKAKWELLKPIAQSHFQNGYKITARFFLWLEEQYKMEFVKELNGIAAAGSYTNAFWNAKFGKGVDELWDEYRAANGLEAQPAPVQTIKFITRKQVLDSLLKVYATRDSLVKTKFEITAEFVFAPNVLVPPADVEESSAYLYWYNHPIFANRRHTLINRTVEAALKFAYGKSKMLVIYDSARLFPALNEAIFKKRYCFDIIVSKEQEENLDELFIARINDHFKINTRIDTLEQPVLVLKKVEGFVFTKPDRKGPENKPESSHELFMQGIMEPYILIGNFLDSYTKLPVIDETGLKEAYDFGFRFGDGIVLHGAESKEVEERLKKHGLRLEKAVRKYPALIISR